MSSVWQLLFSLFCPIVGQNFIFFNNIGPHFIFLKVLISESLDGIDFMLGNSWKFNKLHLSFPLLFAFIICVGDQQIHSATRSAVKTEVQPILVKGFFAYWCKKPYFFWFAWVDFAVIMLGFIVWLFDSLTAVADLEVNFFFNFFFLVCYICYIQETRRTVVCRLSLKIHKSFGHHNYIFRSVASLNYYMSLLFTVAHQSLKPILQNLIVLLDSFDHLATVLSKNLFCIWILILLYVSFIRVDFTWLNIDLIVLSQRAHRHSMVLLD